jgi:hypothetical protein
MCDGGGGRAALHDFMYEDEDAYVDELLANHCAREEEEFTINTIPHLPQQIPAPPKLETINGAWAACSIAFSNRPPILLQLSSNRIMTVFAILPLTMVSVNNTVRVISVFPVGQPIIVLHTHHAAYGDPAFRFFYQHYTNAVVREIKDMVSCEWCARDRETAQCEKCGRRVCGQCTLMMHADLDVRRVFNGYTHVCPACVCASESDVFSLLIGT